MTQHTDEFFADGVAVRRRVRRQTPVRGCGVRARAARRSTAARVAGHGGPCSRAGLVGDLHEHRRIAIPFRIALCAAAGD